MKPSHYTNISILLVLELICFLPQLLNLMGVYSLPYLGNGFYFFNQLIEAGVFFGLAFYFSKKDFKPSMVLSLLVGSISIFFLILRLLSIDIWTTNGIQVLTKAYSFLVFILGISIVSNNGAREKLFLFLAGIAIGVNGAIFLVSDLIGNYPILVLAIILNHAATLFLLLFFLKERKTNVEDEFSDTILDDF